MDGAGGGFGRWKFQREGAGSDEKHKEETSHEKAIGFRMSRSVLECASPLALSSGHEIYDLEEHSERKAVIKVFVGSEFATSAESSRGLEHSRTLSR
jgi:hypothetical protein